MSALELTSLAPLGDATSPAEGNIEDGGSGVSIDASIFCRRVTDGISCTHHKVIDSVIERGDRDSKGCVFEDNVTIK